MASSVCCMSLSTFPMAINASATFSWSGRRLGSADPQDALRVALHGKFLLLLFPMDITNVLESFRYLYVITSWSLRMRRESHKSVEHRPTLPFLAFKKPIIFKTSPTSSSPPRVDSDECCETLQSKPMHDPARRCCVACNPSNKHLTAAMSSDQSHFSGWHRCNSSLLIIFTKSSIKSPSSCKTVSNRFVLFSVDSSSMHKPYSEESNLSLFCFPESPELETDTFHQVNSHLFTVRQT